MSAFRRIASVSLGVAGLLVALASPALADPPGPTDYQTEVIGIEPSSSGFSVEVIGGDSFISIAADPGVRLEVVGYRGEPYLRFGPDGIVEQNDNSPTTYLNIDRYGIADIPGTASADAKPDWVVVATDGSFAWHDHRAHWMNEARPPGREEGEVVLEGVVPLIVDGAEVDVSVQSIWQPAPSVAPVLVGMAIGLAVGAVAALRNAGMMALSFSLFVLAAAAAALGVVAVISVPPETGPPWSLWIPPLAALTLALASLGSLRLEVMRRNASSLALIGALVLIAWGVLHQEWMWRAVLPTDSPFWIERMVTGAVLVGGVGLVMLIGRAQVLGTDRQPA
jgi:hypothetical protein